MSDPTPIVVALVSTAAILGAAIIAYRGAQGRAREQRRQDRIGPTYRDALVVANRVEVWAVRTTSLFSGVGYPAPPGLPSEDDLLRLKGDLDAYGSPDMQRAFEAMAAAVRELNRALARRQEVTDRAARGLPIDAADDLAATAGPAADVRTNRVLPAVAALRAQANAELAERHTRKSLISGR